MLLKPNKKHEFPIVVEDCREIFLHELVYLNKAEPDLIEKCTVIVNGQEVQYRKSQDCPKTYFVEGKVNYRKRIPIEPGTDVKFLLNISCGDFSVCQCLDHRFQLKLSAAY